MTHSLFAPEPDCQRMLAADVFEFMWSASSSTSRTAVIIPGWGAHPRYYGTLVSALIGSGFEVRSVWATSADSRSTSLGHYQHLEDFFDQLRIRQPDGLYVVAESLGAIFLLSQDLLRDDDASVLIAPGGIPRVRQVLSPHGLRDAFSLVFNGEVPLLGWRLNSVSDNPQFRREVLHAKLTPTVSQRKYVISAALAAVHTLVSPHFAGRGLVLHGAADRLLAPASSRFVAKRLGSQVQVDVISGVGHGVLWDANAGSSIAQRIVTFFEDNA